MSKENEEAMDRVLRQVVTEQILTIRHYKEPLKAIEEKDGYGYWGCLTVTADGTRGMK